MKFSRLVALRNHLQSVYNTGVIHTGLDRLRDELTNTGTAFETEEFGDGINQLVNDLQNLYSKLDCNRHQFNELIDSINQRVVKESQHFFSDNYELELKYNDVEVIRTTRVMPLTEQTREDILNRIRLYTSWKYPALEIGCRDGEWTKHLVAADPLYIVDHFREFTDAATRDFTEEYRRRIRVYLTPEHDLSQLPKSQFSFVFCWNILNYCSLDTVKEYLKEVKTLLRPGGTFMFSYNDGDTEAGAGMAETFFMSYIPKHLLIPLCESLGYDIVTAECRDTNVSWIEVRLPGELKTVKAHQVMGEIKRIQH